MADYVKQLELGIEIEVDISSSLNCIVLSQDISVVKWPAVNDKTEKLTESVQHGKVENSLHGCGLKNASD
jgi:hypothetical protein